MGLLQNKMRLNMELKGFTESTMKNYLHEVKQFVKFYMKSPEVLGENEVKEYLHYLIKIRGFSNSKVRIAYSGLKFLYSNTMHQSWFMDGIPMMSKEMKTPGCDIEREDFKNSGSHREYQRSKHLSDDLFGGTQNIRGSCSSGH